jgi:hypothetical protein
MKQEEYFLEGPEINHDLVRKNKINKVISTLIPT